MPEDLTGKQAITITTDAGTTATIPVTVESATTPDKPEPPADNTATGSADIADILIGVWSSVLGIIAAIAAAIGLNTAFNG